MQGRRIPIGAKKDQTLSCSGFVSRILNIFQQLSVGLKHHKDGDIGVVCLDSGTFNETNYPTTPNKNLLMTKINYKQTFTRFLKQQKAYLPYRYNLYNEGGKTTKIWLCLHPINIPSAFLWNHTKEGTNYWEQLQQKYISYVKQIQNKTLNR